MKCSEQNIEEIICTIREGGVVVFPTDTVYGIGCDPYVESAVQRIYKIKQRGQEKPLPVLAFSIDGLEDIVELDSNARRIAEKFWPGQVTMILNLKDKVLGKSLGVKDRIAVRVPNGACIRSILEKCSLLVGTSANPSGMGSFVDPEDCIKNMQDYDVFVDGGVIEGRGESTIVDLTGEQMRVAREGAVTKTEVVNAI